VVVELQGTPYYKIVVVISSTSFNLFYLCRFNAIEFYDVIEYMVYMLAMLIEIYALKGVMVPYYKGNVPFSLKKLLLENGDGVYILFYLPRIYTSEQKDFLG